MSAFLISYEIVAFDKKKNKKTKNKQTRTTKKTRAVTGELVVFSAVH